ncbi:hypothetical protein OIU85_000254 [Salix viminalis]|uniref:Cytochrome P450 n=1 Tax=Salix viminalis TaxID=40686 RepID=A0A9Q0VJL6_SALVM|nr:hypothetical protein OIU85_000254 [Salix viminalis]
MEVLSLQILLLLLFLSLYFYLYAFSSKKKPASKGFKAYPIVGSLPEFVRNRHRFLEWTTETLSHCPANTAVFHRPGKANGIITASPLNVEHILKTNFENYPKGDRFINLLEDFLGRGIFNSDGELWRVQRKTASYEFNTKSLRNFVMDNVEVEISTRLVPVLAKASKTKKVLDLQDILERFAFDNICKVAFNVDPDCLGGDGTSGEKRLRKSIKIVHEFADEMIRSRMEQKTKNNDEDLLSRFIGKEENSTEFLRDIVISFILAGRDTTSSALSWFFWLMSVNPDVERKILKELETIRSSNGKNLGDTYSFEELRDMQYLQAAISETMRLYPPVPVDTKACKSDDVLPDGHICGKELESPFKFPVFNAGPRMCLGKDMAYIQMKSIAASVIERFQIDVQNKEQCPEHLLSLTLRMKGGLQVKVSVEVNCTGSLSLVRRTH